MAESYRFGHWGPTSEEILRTHFPLHRACRDGDAEALSLLLVEHQQGVYAEDSFYGWTPAHWAAYFGKLACLRKLIQNSSLAVEATCDLLTSRFTQTPAHLAAFGGHPQCLLWLLQSGAQFEAQDYLGESTVHKAARTGSIECISLLASHGANLSKPNNNRQSPAHLAALCGYVECARYLEAAAIRQDLQCPDPDLDSLLPLSPTTPSPLDITATVKGYPHRCVINQGVNGGQLPPPGPLAADNDIPVDMEDCQSQPNGHCQSDTVNCHPADLPMSNGHPGNGHSTSNGHSMSSAHTLPNGRDVTLHRGISTNTVPVAGRKRSREDDEESDHKRIRTSEPEMQVFSGPSLTPLATGLAPECCDPTSMDCTGPATHSSCDNPLSSNSAWQGDGIASNNDLYGGGGTFAIATNSEGMVSVETGTEAIDMACDDSSVAPIKSDDSTMSEERQPYQEVLAMSVEPMKPVLPRGEQLGQRNQTRSNQFWAF